MSASAERSYEAMESMPTFEVTDRFWNDYDKLSAEEQNAMDEARRTFTEALRKWERGHEGES